MINSSNISILIKSMVRILRWVREEEERAIKMNESSIKCIVLDMAGKRSPSEASLNPNEPIECNYNRELFVSSFFFSN